MDYHLRGEKKDSRTNKPDETKSQILLSSKNPISRQLWHSKTSPVTTKEFMASVSL